MLHAVLHGKLDESNPEAQRLEDALTSTVFGTLALVEASGVFSRWFAGVRVPSAATPAQANAEVWFWPTLVSPEYTAQPDVLVRLGDSLFIVEAKYSSGRHDVAQADSECDDESDQLARQHHCALTPPHQRRRYDDDLERALAECRLVHIFLVNGRRTGRVRREFGESKESMPGVDLRLRTWQELDRILYELPFHDGRARWVQDLRCYLALEGLESFIGFRNSDLGAPEVVGRAAAWGHRATQPGLRRAVLGSDSEHLRLLLGWTSARPQACEIRLVAPGTSGKLAAAVRPLMTWRMAASSENRYDAASRCRLT